MITPALLSQILEDVDLGWMNLHLKVAGDGSYIQIWDENLPTEFNSGRKFRISPHMTKSEVVQTAFAALMAWWEHEAREAFTYGGRAIFGPHHDVDALWEIADRTEYRASVPS